MPRARRRRLQRQRKRHPLTLGCTPVTRLAAALEKQAERLNIDVAISPSGDSVQVTTRRRAVDSPEAALAEVIRRDGGAVPQVMGIGSQQLADRLGLGEIYRQRATPEQPGVVFDIGRKAAEAINRKRRREAAKTLRRLGAR